MAKKHSSSAKQLGKYKLSKIRRCVNSMIYAASNNLLPDYRCHKTEVACRLYWRGSCKEWEQFPKTYDA